MNYCHEFSIKKHCHLYRYETVENKWLNRYWAIFNTNCNAIAREKCSKCVRLNNVLEGYLIVRTLFWWRCIKLQQQKKKQKNGKMQRNPILFSLNASDLHFMRLLGSDVEKGDSNEVKTIIQKMRTYFICIILKVVIARPTSSSSSSSTFFAESVCCRRCISVLFVASVRSNI